MMWVAIGIILVIFAVIGVSVLFTLIEFLVGVLLVSFGVAIAK